MKATELVSLLIGTEDISLAVWHGEPMSPREAAVCSRAVRDGLYGHAGKTPARFGSRLAEMIIRYWTARDVHMQYELLLATARSTTEKARLELCYGQLLMARKISSAWNHLDEGFERAAHLFEPDAYFVVLKRHDRLRALQLSPAGTEAAGLDALLKEADVIRRLRGKHSGAIARGTRHQDTVD